MNDVLAAHEFEGRAELKEKAPDDEIMEAPIDWMRELRNFIPQGSQRKCAVCATVQRSTCAIPAADWQYTSAEILAIVNRVLRPSRELSTGFDVHAQIPPSAECHDEVDVRIRLDAIA